MDRAIKPRIKAKLVEVTRKLPDVHTAMRKQIKGALKSAIADHGPINKNLIGSVLKRLENQPVYRSILDGRKEAKAA